MMDNIIKPNPYKIIEIVKETDIEWTFKFRTDIKASHGQFIMLSIPKVGEVPISVSGQGDNTLEFTIRKVGKVTDEIFSKKVGDSLFLRGPYGHGWPMETLKGKHLVVIAGGTGVSPVRSLLNYAEKNKDFALDVSLILGFKNHNSILFKDDLARWKEAFKYTKFCLDCEECEGFNMGFVTTYIDSLPLEKYDNNYEVIVVGPPIMMKFVGEGLLKKGFDIDHIYMSFERKMSCGVGKCGHCRIDEVYVCLDGPVFPYKVAKALID